MRSTCPDLTETHYPAAWRYVEQTVSLLAAQVPKLRKAVRAAKKAGYAYVVLRLLA
jgi:hypothetical protein